MVIVNPLSNIQAITLTVAWASQNSGRASQNNPSLAWQVADFLLFSKKINTHPTAMFQRHDLCLLFS